MKITICCSIAHFDEAVDIKNKLIAMGHEVDLPPTEVKDKDGNMIPVKEYYRIRKEGDESEAWIWERKREAIKKHFDKIVWADALLITNYEKNGIPGYIGANVLMEMGLACHLDKPIYLVNPIPEVSYKEELLGMQPVVINGDLNLVK